MNKISFETVRHSAEVSCNYFNSFHFSYSMRQFCAGEKPKFSWVLATAWKQEKQPITNLGWSMDNLALLFYKDSLQYHQDFTGLVNHELPTPLDRKVYRNSVMDRWLPEHNICIVSNWWGRQSSVVCHNVYLWQGIDVNQGAPGTKSGRCHAANSSSPTAPTYISA